MALPEDFLSELRVRSDIGEIAGSYVNLKRRGRNLVGLCPFHNEKTPSFNIYTETDSFFCFGCGVGGDVITFIKKIENLDYMEAVRFLAQRAGLEVPQDSQNDGLASMRSRIYEANRTAARFFYAQLSSSVGQNALAYLTGRGLSNATLKHFGLGYSPNSRYALCDFLRSKGFSESEIVAANLAYKNNNGRISDRFFDRVMFPIIDLRGNVIAFGGRIMGEGKPKYLNTSDTIVFKKSANLFALNTAKNSKSRSLILAEGYMDVIALHQAGFTNAVATLGTALTAEQANLIKRYADEVTIAYDSDEAGQKAAARAIELLRNAGVLIKVLKIPGAKDPDEYIKQNGDQGAVKFKVLLENSGNDVEYNLEKLKAIYDIKSTDGKVQYLTESAKVLAKIENDIERDIYISKLSEEMQVQREAVLSQVKKFSKIKASEERKRENRRMQQEISGYGDKINKEKYKNPRVAKAEESLIAYLFNNPDMAKKINRQISYENFKTAFNGKVFKIVMERLLSGKEASLMDISSQFADEEIARIAKILSLYSKEAFTVEAAQEFIDTILIESNRIDPAQASELNTQDIMDQLDMIKNQKNKNSL